MSLLTIEDAERLAEALGVNLRPQLWLTLGLITLLARNRALSAEDLRELAAFMDAPVALGRRTEVADAIIARLLDLAEAASRPSS